MADLHLHHALDRRYTLSTRLAASPTPLSVLAVNGGSSSVRFAFFHRGRPLTPSLHGKVDRIGLAGMTLSWRGGEEGPREGKLEVPAGAWKASLLTDWLEARKEFASVEAVGHRVVHGMAHTEPVRVTPEFVDELRRAIPYAPDHLPAEIELIEAFGERHPLGGEPEARNSEA